MLWSKVIGAGGAGGVVEGWNISTAVLNQSFSVAAQEFSPSSLRFNFDGSKMYVLGYSGDDVNEYDLSISWDVSTAVFLQNKTVAAQNSIPTGLFFRDDGLKMYVLGISTPEVNEYSLGIAWDISSAGFTRVFSGVSSQETTPFGLFFRPDGFKMYIVGQAGNDINEYNLSTAWNISTAVFNQSFSVASEDGNPAGLFFKPDGLKMYICGQDGDDINEYDLSTAWDISTAVFNQLFPVDAYETSPTDVFFRDDGLKMYVIGIAGDAVLEYDIG